jgi:hypothetical protein
MSSPMIDAWRKEARERAARLRSRQGWSDTAATLRRECATDIDLYEAALAKAEAERDAALAHNERLSTALSELQDSQVDKILSLTDEQTIALAVAEHGSAVEASHQMALSVRDAICDSYKIRAERAESALAASEARERDLFNGLEYLQRHIVRRAARWMQGSNVAEELKLLGREIEFIRVQTAQPPHAPVSTKEPHAILATSEQARNG